MAKKRKLYSNIGIITCITFLLLIFAASTPINASSDSTTTTTTATTTKASTSPTTTGLTAEQQQADLAGRELARSIAQPINDAVGQVVGSAYAALQQFVKPIQDVMQAYALAAELKSQIGILIANGAIGINGMISELQSMLSLNTMMVGIQENLAGQRAIALQQTSTAALAAKGAMDNSTYLATENKMGIREALSATKKMGMQNVAAALCPGYTYKAGLPAYLKYADDMADKYYKVFADFASGNHPLVENSAADAATQLLPLFQAACASPVLGSVGIADPELCMSRLYTKVGGPMSADEAAVVNPFMAALQAFSLTATTSPGPGFRLAEASTDELQVFFTNMADKAIAAQLFRATAGHWATNVRTKGINTAVIKIRETLVASGAFSQESVDKMLPPGGISESELLAGLALAMNAVKAEMQVGMDPDAAQTLQTMISNLQVLLYTMMMEKQEEANKIAVLAAYLQIGQRDFSTLVGTDL